MEAAVIDRIRDLAAETEVEVRGRTYSARTLTPVNEPLALGLQFHTLGGLATYLLSRFDAEEVPGYAVHVVNEILVQVVSELNEDRRRECYAEANVLGEAFPFGKFLDHEIAMIGLQALFVDTAELAGLLKVLGTVTADEVNVLADDGVTQRVTANAGVTLKDRVDLPSPVTLRPYRTFREVEQPESEFVLRVKKVAGEIKVGLFEADGGAWKIEAVKNVAEWLRDKLGDAEVFA